MLAGLFFGMTQLRDVAGDDDAAGRGFLLLVFVPRNNTDEQGTLRFRSFGNLDFDRGATGNSPINHAADAFHTPQHVAATTAREE